MVIILFIAMAFLFTEPKIANSGTPPNLIHGELWNYTSNSTAWEMKLYDGVGVYHNISNLSAGDVKWMTPVLVDAAQGGSYLTADYSGIYLLNLHISAYATVRNLYSFEIQRNHDKNTGRNCYARIDVPKNSVGVGSVSCFMVLNAGDSVSVAIEPEESPVGDIWIHTVNLNAMRIDR